MKQASEQLYRIIRPVVESLGYELVGIEFHNRPRNSLLRIYIDREGGVDVDDCALVSNQVSGVLDVEDAVRGHYTLEISSPGLDRPLFSLDHFRRFVGSRVKLKLEVPVEGRRNWSGRIRQVEDEVLILEDEQGEEYRLPFADVEQARLVPEW
ncbi:MAG TPA: ribosome maturation factor RimP [Thiotrichales bacterium]|nr:ribosome maturation factor RimP [Thiotrichales bacterium]